MANTSSGGVQGQGFISILVDGESLPPTPGLVRSINIIENTFSVPCAVLVLADRNNALRSNNAIVDGTLITLTVGSDIESTATVTFSTVACREYDEDGIRMLRVIVAMNSKKFMYDTAGFSTRGTSIKVLQEICTRCGLTLDSDIKPDDNMLWLSMAQSPKRFSSEIEQHIWINEEALPKIVLTADLRMIVRDANAVLHGKPKATLIFNSAEQKAGEIQIHEFRPKSTSGVFNGVSNYGDRLLWNSSDGKTHELKGVTVKSKESLNVNSDTREGIVGTRQAYARNTNEINLHPNFQRAYYNWKRQSLAYTESALALVIGGVPDIDLLDCVEIKAGFPTAQVDQQFDPKTSGNWLVIGRTKSFSNNVYSEVFLFARNFTAVEGTTNVGGGKNIITTPVSTVANILRPFQINGNIKQALDGSSLVDFMQQNHELRLNVLTDQFKLDSNIFSFPELAEKYGEGADYLKSIMQEFSMARFLTGICEAMNSLEKLSINLVIDYGPSILSSLADRIDQMEGMLNGFTGDINGLIADGDIPDYYMDGPSFNQRCVSNKIEDLQKAATDALPDKCLDASSITKLLGPSTNLSQLIRQTEEQLRDLLCAMGDGTVDGSSKFGAPNGEKLETYLPRAAS